MGVEQFHEGTSVWHFVEDGTFNIEYRALESYFNERAREEGVTTEKQYIFIKNIEIEANERIINLTTELYRLLEN